MHFVMACLYVGVEIGFLLSLQMPLHSSNCQPVRQPINLADSAPHIYCCNFPAMCHFVNKQTNSLSSKLMTGELTNVNSSRKFAGKFQQYDNGCSKDGNGPNGEECDRATDAPEYDLSKITIPIDLHYADNDWLASPAVRKRGWVWGWCRQLCASERLIAYYSNYTFWRHTLLLK